MKHVMKRLIKTHKQAVVGSFINRMARVPNMARPRWKIKQKDAMYGCGTAQSRNMRIKRATNTSLTTSKNRISVRRGGREKM